MPRNWTNSQLDAIESRGSDLLVSAGAGSGKTAVLTKRIIRRLVSDPDADVTRMLIVTFTKAAAGELRERISAALSDAIAADPTNKRLNRQLMRLDQAKICTIHSFCLDILRENFTAARLPADFRVADDAEIRLLRRSIVTELIEDAYSGKIQDFERLADALTGTKGDDSLEDTFLELYEDLSSTREGIGFIGGFADELVSDSEKDFGKSRCGAGIMRLVSDQIGAYLDGFLDILPWLESDEKMRKAYLPAFEYEADFIRRINELCELSDYAALKLAFDSYAPPRLGVIRGEKDEDVEAAKAERSEFKKKVAEISKKFFSLPPEKIKENQLATARLLMKLHELLAIFEENFTAEKRRRGIVDFADLERLTLDLLEKDGSPTEAALTAAGHFDEIFIDEYQDVNSLQDAIFSTVAAAGEKLCRFMVGDVKQSIYGFRGAEPAIFESYREKFKYSDAGKTIFLSNNFRCDKKIIDFANLVSGTIFTNATGALPYYPEDDLVHSKSGEEQGHRVKVALLQKPDEESDDDIDISAEAGYVAAEIKQLIKEGRKNDGSRIKYSDIAILARSAAANADDFRKVFEDNGIPLYNNAGGDFFENAEVLLALCLLNTIDDPHRDVYLAGTLKSPLFGFTLDELTLIRRASKDGSLFDALKLYTNENDFEKGRDFLETLRRYQRKAEELPVDKLIWYLYSDTDLPALVFGSGKDSDENQEGDLRRANLTLLYEYARRFEGSSFKGLYNFIRYINDILDDKVKLEPAKIFSEASETVKLMTIHQSKGLEFPVVFLCGCGKRFNESDLRANIVMTRDLGIAMKLPDETGFAKFDTPVRQAIVKKLSDSQIEEEMRVLYVAMTRAREQLYVTAEVKEPQELYEKCCADAKRLSRNVIMQSGGYIKWILTAIGANNPTSENAPFEVIFPEVGESEEVEKVVEKAETESDTDYSGLIRERFDFVYPNEFLTKLPAKLSVSELYPTILDADAATLEPEEIPEITAKIPLFMQDTPDEKATASERGTATHIFMQFCDFERFREFLSEKKPEDGLDKLISDECARLGRESYISPKAASIVNEDQLYGFFASDIFKKICKSPKVFREHRFNVKLPAAIFTADEDLRKKLSGETVLVQGVIDCFFENPDRSFTLLDYKTDHISRSMSHDEAVKMLSDRHRLQLSYYKMALSSITKKEITDTLIYSFALGEVIRVGD